MAINKVLINQTEDIIAPAGVWGGVIQVEIEGVLGSAQLTTEIKSLNDDSWIPILDGTWVDTVDEPFSGSDGALLAFQNSSLRVVLSGSDSSTNISFAIKQA